jgi:membrane-associated phospholipid phosphatase
MREALLRFDYAMWHQVNVVWQSPVLDAVLPFLRNQWFWAPLYIFLLVFMPKNFGRKGWMWCLAFLLTFAVADFVSASLIKPYFMRIRPCNDPRFSEIVHLLVPCGGGKSFPSTHATNHFAMGVFAAMSLQKSIKIVWPIALLWAISVSYAQVYVGVHFPLDVICGALLGSTIGIITGRLFEARYKMRA